MSVGGPENQAGAMRHPELRQRVADDRGISSIEYGLMAVGVVFGLALVVGGVGAAVAAMFDEITAAF